MINEHHVTTETTCLVHPHRRFCWSAVFAGALVGVGIGFLLHLFGMAIGLSAYSSSADRAGMIAIGGILGMLIGVAATGLTAGYTAGYLGRCLNAPRHWGMMYGFTTWSIALLLSMLVAVPGSHYIASFTNSLAKSQIVKNIGEANNEVSGISKPAANDTAMVQKTDEGNALNTPDAGENLAWSSWIIFVLFFAGAFFSCLGACWGAGCRKDYEETPVVRTKM